MVTALNDKHGEPGKRGKSYMRILKTDLKILANNWPSFDTDFEILVRLGRADFTTSKAHRGRKCYSQIQDVDLKTIACK